VNEPEIEVLRNESWIPWRFDALTAGDCYRYVNLPTFDQQEHGIPMFGRVEGLTVDPSGSLQLSVSGCYH